MKSVNDYYYICEKGHVTVGTSKQKKKCDQKIQQIKLVKLGKAKVEKEVVKKTTCGAELKTYKDIPKELNLIEEWDYHTVKAFMTNQTRENLKIKFIQTLQQYFSSMHTMIEDLKNGMNELIRNQKD